MEKKNSQPTELHYEKIAGPIAPFTDEALVHIKDDGDHTRIAYINAYLPTLKAETMKVDVEEGVPMPKVKLKALARDSVLKGTKITITYTSEKGASDYDLWQIFFRYKSTMDLGFEDVVLYDTDPETSRGTVTTPEDPDPDDYKN